MNQSTQMDEFAKIATKGIEHRGNLIIPQPKELPEKYLKNQELNASTNFKPLPKMRTKEALYEELEKQRERYVPFLSSFAPPMPNRRSRRYIKECQWRIQTEEDKKNLTAVLQGEGEWEAITLPHYGGPLGREVTYYRSMVQVTKEEIEVGSLFICFKAVDYKAHIFINGNYIGSHEGFFAPFEFEITEQVVEGENTLLVMVENDYICKGNESDLRKGIHTGDKIYAATGIGYDDPEYGWHHCPPGMGIYQEVYLEARPRIFIKDLFVRPLLKEERAEVWIEIYNCDLQHKEITIEFSLYGQNFKKTIFENRRYKPVSILKVGLGDSFTEAAVKAEGKLNKAISLSMERGVNYLKIPFEIEQPRIWDLETPWLYQIQLTLLDHQEKQIDYAKSQFGMRSFEIDEDSDPKGKFYLNGKEIRLRGANTMGHEQQCVFKRDWEQLISDILLAKICNMNFLRLTQRPVQPEVYDYCDRLGLMTQTDLPLFGVLRRNQFVEAVRQAGEMEHLVRKHPCNIVISYINEPFPNANNMPHRSLVREELEEFFKAADIVVKLHNPDRVIKKVDGDYDPPTDGLPDNHCYPCWYNGHGIDIGRLHKGYWMYVKPQWHYGCGEFGSEGLDPISTMKKYYPKEWLPQEGEDIQWSPNQIKGAQTGNFHYFFYETPKSLEKWVEESQKHQAWATRIMTEAYRRDSRMNSFAIHLFIDAFPSGWMKTIMDVERNPKPAYFAYREALAPILPNIRTDRFTFFEGEEVKLEAWICNDTNVIDSDAHFQYQVLAESQILFSGKEKAHMEKCDSQFQGYISFIAPEVQERTPLEVQGAVIDSQGKVINDCSISIEVFPKVIKQETPKMMTWSKDSKITKKFLEELEIEEEKTERLEEIDTVMIHDYKAFIEKKEEMKRFVQEGGKIIFYELPCGTYEIWGHSIEIQPCGMLPVHFVSRDTGSSLVTDFKKDDFRLWYDGEVDYITPILETTFMGTNLQEILLSGNINKDGKWEKALAAAEFSLGKGKVILCQLKLAGRIKHNPIAQIFAERLL